MSEPIGLFIIYVLIWLLCFFSLLKNHENFLAGIGLILLTIFLPAMMNICGIITI